MKRSYPGSENVAQQFPPETRHDLPEVWILQPRVEHYRLPVFDRLAAAGAERFHLRVVGSLVDGEAAGGGHRDYLVDFPYRRRRIANAELFEWPGIERRIETRRPAVVVANTQLRHLNCWRLPRVCARAGAASVAWGKVHSSSELPSNLLKPFKRRMFRGFDLIVVYGERSRAELLDLGVAAEQIYVAQNTIDTDHIFEHAETLAAEGARLRARHGLEGARILLSVGRLEADKRQHDLLAAWPRLRAADPRLHLVIVGGGPLLADIRERGAALDAEHILVTGRVPVGEDYGWMAAADATIQCGAVGLALNQSMALGKPTIIADEIGSDTEILVHGETGWRYPRGDIDRLVETVTAVLRRDDATARVKARARTLLRDRVNIANMTTNLGYCIDHALAMSSTRRNSS